MRASNRTLMSPNDHSNRSDPKQPECHSPVEVVVESNESKKENES